MAKQKYKFDPTKFGYRPPKRMPKQLRDYLGSKTYVKVICTSEDGSFWYSACHQYGPSDDRWYFLGGLWDANKMQPSGVREPGHVSHTDYTGCITSEKYAKTLLIHLLGTTTNEGTLKYGKERLAAESLRIPKRIPR